MVLIGPFDPLRLSFTIINKLIEKGQLTDEEAKDILMESLNPEMPKEEKERFVNSLFEKKIENGIY